jgi:hypothetical protein
MLAYTRELDALETDLRAYLEHVEASRLAVALRPMAPDARSAQELAAKIEVLDRAGVDRVDLYHYAFMPLDHLAWIRAALRGIRS